MHPGSRTSNASGFTPSRADGSGIAHKSKSPRLAISTLRSSKITGTTSSDSLQPSNSRKTTASEIFRRLNSYSKQHTLYRALKTFGKIIKSIFILRYIDELELRQAIEKQLNKIENSQQFSRAVSIGNPREFTQADKQEQEVAEGCKRLIKNAITCWNYLYLSQKISETMGPEAREILFQAIANGSVVSWQHINLLGEYDFSDEKLQDSVRIKPPKLAA